MSKSLQRKTLCLTACLFSAFIETLVSVGGWKCCSVGVRLASEQFSGNKNLPFSPAQFSPLVGPVALLFSGTSCIPSALQLPSKCVFFLYLEGMIISSSYNHTYSPGLP